MTNILLGLGLGSDLRRGDRQEGEIVAVESGENRLVLCLRELRQNVLSSQLRILLLT